VGCRQRETQYGESGCCSLWLGSGRPSRRQFALGCGRDHTLAQQLRSLSCWHRAAEVEALDARALGLHEKFQLGVSLDAFGDDLDVKFSRRPIVARTIAELP
jgi:hypothetical protein